MGKKKIIVEYDQSIYDLALRYYGSVDYTINILILNPDLDGFDDSIKAGMEIVIDDSFIVDQELVQLYELTGDNIVSLDLSGDNDFDDSDFDEIDFNV